MTLVPWAVVAGERDAADPLRLFRDRFYRREGNIYLDGNSLGLLSQDAETSVLRVLNEWKTQGIEGWTEANPPWFSFSETLAAAVAPMVGVAPEEVIVTGSTTVNLHQLLATLFIPDANEKNRILADELNFPSDIFALQSHLRLRGLDPATHLIRLPSREDRTLSEDDIVAALSRDGIQMAVFPSVVYTTGQLLDMERVTRVAREQGILIGWDCSLTDFLRELVEAELSPFGVRIATPIEADRRGGHLALVHPEAARIGRALRQVGVVPDFRPPDIVRLAPVPLYTTFADCVEAVGRLKAILETRGYETVDGTPGQVT